MRWRASADPNEPPPRLSRSASCRQGLARESSQRSRPRISSSIELRSRHVTTPRSGADLDSQQLILGIVWYVVFLFSTTCHEAAHAWAARRGGDPTAYLGGQVSLDPRPHIRREPFGTVVVPILSFLLGGWMIGWASTPYDPRWAEAYPRRAAWMSLAGPGANLALVLISGVLVRAGLAAGVWAPPILPHMGQVAVAHGSELGASVALLVSVFFTLNLLLLTFNLLPLPPLDGSGALPLVLGDRAAAAWLRLMRQPAMGLIGLLLAWNLFGPVFGRFYRLALQLLYSGGSIG